MAQYRVWHGHRARTGILVLRSTFYGFLERSAARKTRPRHRSSRSTRRAIHGTKPPVFARHRTFHLRSGPAVRRTCYIATTITIMIVVVALSIQNGGRRSTTTTAAAVSMTTVWLYYGASLLLPSFDNVIARDFFLKSRYNFLFLLRIILFYA